MIPIVFENPDFVVVNKPVGIAMHGQGCGIISLLQTQLQLAQLYLVHRLDTPTSGCLLVAKSKQAAADLSALFANRAVQKYYLAISDKKPKKKQGKISGDMQSTRGGNYRLSNSHVAPAITFFFSYSFICENQALRLFYLKPITGKTHQLRVALKTLGSPIIGDDRYKGNQNDRMYLHSHAIGFCYKQQHYLIKCMPQSGALFQQLSMDSREAIENLAWPQFSWPQKNISITHNE